MGTILAHFALPQTSGPGREILYFRVHGSTEKSEAGLTISERSTVAFNTYFNAFFYPKYLNATAVEQIRIVLLTTGNLSAKVICEQKGGESLLLSEVQISGTKRQTQLPTYLLSSLPENGALYVELTAHDQPAQFIAGWYETENKASVPAKVAAVICTYHREGYVQRNLEVLRTQVWEDSACPIRDNLDVFIVDNGRTLNLPVQEHVRVFPNPNYGGSGGFARGMLETLRRPEYTHVLLMDDDITLEVESLVKTVQLLKYEKRLQRSLWIGGQMLIESAPTTQFESGSFYREGRLMPVGRGLDVSDWKAVLSNEVEHCVDYTAWWYCCIPVSCIRQYGLPMPFFIKTDDVEYGLRCQPQILLMNGIGIWHTAFSEKYSPHLEYYIKRNELIVSALYRRGDGPWHSIWKIMRASAKALLIGEPRTVAFLLRACRDFLHGPGFFLQTDEEKLNTELVQQMKHPVQRGRVLAALTFPFRALIPMSKLLFRYRRIQKAYLSRRSQLTSVSFWSSHLRISSDD